MFAETDKPTDVPARLRADSAVCDEVLRKALQLAPIFAQAQDDRNARRIVNELEAQLLSREEIVHEVQKLPDISESMRQRALSYIELHTDDASRLDAACWRVVRQPGREPAEYDKALRLAELVSRQAPDNAQYLTTLGAAYYRTNDWQQASRTLTRCNELGSKRYPNDDAKRSHAPQYVPQYGRDGQRPTPFRLHSCAAGVPSSGKET